MGIAFFVCLLIAIQYTSPPALHETFADGVATVLAAIWFSITMVIYAIAVVGGVK